MPLPSVAINPWLSCAFIFTMQLSLPGLAWSWLLYRPTASRLFQGSVLVFLGLTANLLTNLGLLELSAFTPANNWFAIFAITAVGLTLGLWRKFPFLALFQRLLPILLYLFCGAAVIMLKPKTGEWLIGGWDPGTYLNEGVYVHHLGSFHPPPDTIYSLFTPDELSLFTRPAFNYLEGFPVFPLNPETRSFDLFFFRLYPTAIAFFDACGGLRAATRTNFFLGLLTLLPLLTAWRQISLSRASAIFAALIFLLHPIWLYHLHIPVTEPLQLFLWCSFLSFLPYRSTHQATQFFLAAIFLLLMLNHFSFLPFGALLLVILAWADRERVDRRRVVQERLALIAALAVGAAFDLTANTVTLGRLAFILPLLLKVTLPLAMLALLLDLFPANRGQYFLFKIVPPLAVGSLVIGFLLALLGAFPLEVSWLHEFMRNTVGVWPFFGILLSIFATLGAIICYRSSIPRYYKALIFFMLAVTVITLVKSAINGIYPWATRRYLVYSLPAFALLGGQFLGWLRLSPQYWRRIAAVLLLLLLLTTNARKIYQSITHTEFNGYSQVLAKVAAQIGPRDIVIADHFGYGTPLRFIYGKNVINGEVLWAKPDPNRMTAALSTLARIHDQGYRILFLSSIPEGLSVYPAPVEPAALIWTSQKFVYQQITHNRRETHFPLRDCERLFRFYNWVPNSKSQLGEKL